MSALKDGPGGACGPVPPAGRPVTSSAAARAVTGAPGPTGPAGGEQGGGGGVELTVVIAAWNAEATLAAQLDALVRQCATFPWEVVVADNGSTDGTTALARGYADRLALRVVDASGTRGAGAARNVGVEAARAPLVAFCDADDVVADSWVATVRTALREHAFVAGRFEGELLNAPRVLRSRTLPQRDGLQESENLPGLRAAGAGNMGVHADVFRAVGGFDPHCRFLEDTDLCWRIQLAGVPLTWLPEALVHVRLRGSLRSAARQGYDYGTGERWLALRYREQEARLQALAAQGRAQVADDAGAPGQGVEEVDAAALGSGGVVDPASAAGVAASGGSAEPAGAADAADAGGGAGASAGAATRGARAGAALTGAALTGAALTDAALTGGLLAAGPLAGGAAGGAALAGAVLAGAGVPPDRVHRPGASRALHRGLTTLGALVRVRSLGELGAWCWDLGFGLGYAFGRVETPPPVRLPEAPVLRPAAPRR